MQVRRPLGKRPAEDATALIPVVDQEGPRVPVEPPEHPVAVAVAARIEQDIVGPIQVDTGAARAGAHPVVLLDRVENRVL